MSSIDDERDANYAWDVACRRRQYDAELRVNVVRIVAVGLFYLVHLAHYHVAAGFVPDTLTMTAYPESATKLLDLKKVSGQNGAS